MEHDPDHLSDQTFNTAVNPEVMRMQGQQPRIAFTGVTARAFALKASINQLQRFCDNYLNFVDEPGDTTGHYFKAALPFVYLQMINYGKMSTESENLGWIAQHEVLFSVPVEWYVQNPETGKLEFKDWALVCPYVFVDNDQSLQTGREVFGWTKARSWLQPMTTSWTTDPRMPRQLLTLRTEMFPKLYDGQTQEPRTLIEIVQDAPPSLFRNPLARNDAFNPLWSIPQAMRQSYSLMLGAFEAAAGLPILGYQRSRDVTSSGRMLRKAMQTYRGLLPWMSARPNTMEQAHALSRSNAASPYVNNVTLKQFRDAQEPELACYQALVNSKIAVENYHDGGLLGGPSVLMGDLTGGYRIRVHDYAEQPIVSTLGLEVAGTESAGQDHKVDTLTPVLPFWMSCDLRYDLGERLCWRTKHKKWCRNLKHHVTGSAPPSTAPQANRYNTTRGASIQESIGPFHFPDTTMRVFPLLADSTLLQKFIDAHLNKLVDAGAPIPSAYERPARDEFKATAMRSGDDIGENRFETWGSYVYMVVTSNDDEIGKPYSEQNNIGSIVGREVSFWVPVKWYVDGELANVAFVTPFVFCDNMRQVITEREVTGRAAMHCTIDSEHDYWLREAGPAAHKRTLAKLRTLLMPALNVGQPAEMCDLIEIYEGDIDRSVEERQSIKTKSSWASQLAASRKAMAGEKKSKSRKSRNSGDSDSEWESVQQYVTDALTSGRPINFLTLKQYRATENASAFCYQALVLVEKKITQPRHVEEMTMPMHIGIHEYPTMPIVCQLGLRVKSTDSLDHGVVSQLEPVRPFFARVSIKEELGKNLYIREPGKAWERDPKNTQIEDLGDATETIERLGEPQAVVQSLLDRTPRG